MAFTDHPDYPAEHISAAAKRRPAKKSFPGGYIVALVAAAVGFVLKLSSSTSETVNGEVVACSYFDVSPFLAAAVIVIAGIAGLVTWLRQPKGDRFMPALMIVVPIILALVTVVHVLRGLGIVGGPC